MRRARCIPQLNQTNCTIQQSTDAAQAYLVQLELQTHVDQNKIRIEQIKQMRLTRTPANKWARKVARTQQTFLDISAKQESMSWSVSPCSRCTRKKTSNLMSRNPKSSKLDLGRDCAGEWLVICHACWWACIDHLVNCSNQSPNPITTTSGWTQGWSSTWRPRSSTLSSYRSRLRLRARSWWRCRWWLSRLCLCFSAPP